MLIVSAKVSKKKILLGLLAAVCVIALLVFLFRESDVPSDPAAPSVPSNDGGTNEERLAFLRAFGWEPEQTPSETQEVRIPEEFNEVFTRYNRLQQSQGYDLTPYAGKAVKRYVYLVSGHPDGCGGCHATLLVYRGQIIGGDVTCGEQGGSMQGFSMGR